MNLPSVRAGGDTSGAYLASRGAEVGTKTIGELAWRFALALAVLACLYNAVYAPSQHKGAVAAGWVAIAATAALLATFLRRKGGGR